MISQKHYLNRSLLNSKQYTLKPFSILSYNNHKKDSKFNDKTTKNNLSNKSLEHKIQKNIKINKQMQRFNNENENLTNIFVDQYKFIREQQFMNQQSQDFDQYNRDSLFDVKQQRTFLKLQDISNNNNWMGMEHDYFLKQKQKNEYFYNKTKNEFQNQEKQVNDQNDGNKIYINMKKKIKKINKSKITNQNLNSLNNKIQPFNEDLKSMTFNNQEIQEEATSLYYKKDQSFYQRCLSQAYNDNEVIMNLQMYETNTISHRIDNDADSDDQQISTAIKKMHTFLINAVTQNKKQQIKNNIKAVYYPQGKIGRIY